MATLSPKLLAKMREAKITLAHGYFAYSSLRYKVILDGTPQVYLKNLVEVKKYVTAYFDCKENDLPAYFKTLGIESTFRWFIHLDGSKGRGLTYKGKLTGLRDCTSKESIIDAARDYAVNFADAITPETLTGYLALFEYLGYRWQLGHFGHSYSTYQISFRGFTVVGHCDDLLQVANFCQQFERARW